MRNRLDLPTALAFALAVTMRTTLGLCLTSKVQSLVAVRGSGSKSPFQPSIRCDLPRYGATRLYLTSSQTVSSLQSNTVKKYQALLSKRKKRVEAQQCVVEGPRIIKDLLYNPATNSLVKQILVDEKYLEETSYNGYKNDDNESDIYSLVTSLRELDSDRLSVLPASTDVINACSDTVTPQGMVALVDIPQSRRTTNNDRDIESHSLQQQSPLYLVLDGVADPGNVGTLIRSSVATGIAGVITLPGTADIWSPKTLRSSMGASFNICIQSLQNWDECDEFMLQKLSRIDSASGNVSDTDATDRVHAYAATMLSGTKSTSYLDVEWAKESNTSRITALIIGNEGNGLSQGIRDIMNAGSSRIRPVYVPMQPNIESLNAAVCGSVILFEYARQVQLLDNSE